jgi:hypothetical protein
MGNHARVTSIDSLRDMAAALQMFRSEVGSALDDVDMELRRALEWIQHDRKEFWTKEVRRGWDRVTETRVQLQQAKMIQRVADHEPGCYDEKKAMDRAKHRLAHAEETLEAVKHWTHVIEHEVNEYRGRRVTVLNFVDIEVPKALSMLDRMITALEAYIAIQTAGQTGASPSLSPEALAAIAAQAFQSAAQPPAEEPAAEEPPATESLSPAEPKPSAIETTGEAAT